MQIEKALAPTTAWTLLDGLEEGIVLVEPDGSVQYANPAALALLDSSGATAVANITQLLPNGQLWPQLQEAPASVIHEQLQFESKLVTHDKTELLQIVICQAKPTSLPPYISVDQLTALTRVSNEPDIDRKLQLLVDGLQQLGWNRVGLSLRDEAFKPTQFFTAGFTAVEKAHLVNNALPPSIWLDLFQNKKLQQYRHDFCYFVPGNSEWSQANLGTILPDETAKFVDETSWHPKDILCAVLYDRQKQRIGMIGLDQPQSGRRPDLQMRQTLALYAQFAASVIENAQLVNDSLARNNELEILFEASQALSHLLERDQVLLTMSQHMLRAVQADGVIIYRWQESTQQLTAVLEYAPTYSNLSVLGTAVDVEPSSELKQLLNQRITKTAQHSENAHTALPLPAWITDDTCFTCAVLPLVRSNETYGIIHLLKKENHRNLGKRDAQLLTALANQAGTALETALIFEDTYERERFYNALGNVNLAINYTLDRHKVLDLVCGEALRIFEVDGAYIWQLDKHHLTLNAAYGYAQAHMLDSQQPLSENDPLISHILRHNEAMFINDIAAEEIAHFGFPQPEAVQSIMSVPLAKEGRAIGLLILVNTNQDHPFNDKKASWATLFGVQASVALQNAHLFEDLLKFNEELDARVAERTQALNEESNRVKILLRITNELSASLEDQDRVLSLALNLVNEVANATRGVILLMDPVSDGLILRASLGESVPLPPRGTPSGLSRNDGLSGWIIDNRSAVIVQDTRQDPRWIELPTTESSHLSVLGVPLITNDEVIGVIMLMHTEEGAFTAQQLALVEAAAIQVANAVSNANLYQLIWDQADQLGAMLRSERIQRANLQAILESMADGVIVADSRNVIDLVNIPAATILDIPREQLNGRSINGLLGLYGHFETSWLRTIDDWARNSDRIEPGTVMADQLQIEDKFISVNLSPVISDNQFFGTVSIFRDITKEVEVDKLKTEFVSTVSHELRTPMTSIKGYADLILMGAAGALSDAQNQYMKVIKNNADRLHMLVNDLLNISRIETGKTVLDLRPLDVPQIIEQIVNGHLNGRIQHEGKKLAVSKHYSPALPLVSADHGRVTQILTNLLDNAYNYTPENGSITITAHANSHSVYITVEDSGIGIAKENTQKIFDRFFRAEDDLVQRVPGTGLGLSIVNSLVEMHGGQLKVESEPGKGSKFTFNLPIVVEDGDITSLPLT